MNNDSDEEWFDVEKKSLKLANLSCSSCYLFGHIVTKIITIKASLNKSLMLNTIKTKIIQENILDMACYGIGSIEKRETSQIQFALFLCLIDIISFKDIRIYLYDPCLTEVDKKICHYFISNMFYCQKNIHKIDRNTLFYMPFCPLILHEQLICKNWDNVNKYNVIILSNSLFNAIKLHTQLSKDKTNHLSMLTKALCSCSEQSIVCDWKWKGRKIPSALYDLCFIKFSTPNNSSFKGI